MSFGTPDRPRPEVAVRTPGTGVFHAETRQFGTVQDADAAHAVLVRWAAPFNDPEFDSWVEAADLDIEGYDYAPAVMTEGEERAWFLRRAAGQF